MTVNILGTEYDIVKATSKTDKNLENMDGYCDRSTKKIVIVDIYDKDVKFEIGAPAWYQRKILRHEIIHAFMFESGMAENYDWGTDDIHNEAIVDWIAIQGPKIIRAWKEVGCLE